MPIRFAPVHKVDVVVSGPGRVADPRCGWTLIEPSWHVPVLGQHGDGFLEHRLRACVIGPNGGCSPQLPQLSGSGRGSGTVGLHSAKDRGDVIHAIRPAEKGSCHPFLPGPAPRMGHRLLVTRTRINIIRWNIVRAPPLGGRVLGTITQGTTRKSPAYSPGGGELPRCLGSNGCCI